MVQGLALLDELQLNRIFIDELVATLTEFKEMLADMAMARG